MQGRAIGSACTCPLKCFEKVGMPDIEAIFSNYWGLQSHDQQTAYLVSRVTSQECKCSRVKDRPS